MIGVSLPLDWLLTGEGLPESREDVLLALKTEGVRSIELRTVQDHHTAAEVKGAAQLLWDYGFSISLHGVVKTQENAISELFCPLEELLKDLRQPSVNITVHPIAGDNVKMLTAIADHIERHNLPVTVALENNRLMPDKTQGDSAAYVFEIVKEVDRAEIGICWDMGHYLYWWQKHHGSEPVCLPDKAFFKSVIHTHIHALSDLQTHFPLDSHALPLKEFLDGVCYEYFGIYNIELEYSRFKELRPLIPSLIGSVRELKAKMPICAKLYDEIREHFNDWFASARKVFDEDGAKFGLIHSSSYLFHFNGYRVGMDVVFRNARFLADAQEKCIDYLKNLHLMVISHNHADHFEESLVRELANTQIRWVIPDFMYDMALEWGISPEKIYIAKKDEPITAGNLTILPFEGRHFRPGTQRGTLEYGYYVTAEGMPSIAFPVDVRDFSLENLPDIPKADYCFAHVWLGDGNGLDAVCEPMARDFAEFMLKFSEKNIILAHLYESRKKDKYMWRREHAEFLAAKINELSPKTNVFIPNCGQVIDLK